MPLERVHTFNGLNGEASEIIDPNMPTGERPMSPAELEAHRQATLAQARAVAAPQPAPPQPGANDIASFRMECLKMAFQNNPGNPLGEAREYLKFVMEG